MSNRVSIAYHVSLRVERTNLSCINRFSDIISIAVVVRTVYISSIQTKNEVVVSSSSLQFQTCTFDYSERFNSCYLRSLVTHQRDSNVLRSVCDIQIRFCYSRFQVESPVGDFVFSNNSSFAILVDCNLRWFQIGCNFSTFTPQQFILVCVIVYTTQFNLVVSILFVFRQQQITLIFIEIQRIIA